MCSVVNIMGEAGGTLPKQGDCARLSNKQPMTIVRKMQRNKFFATAQERKLTFKKEYDEIGEGNKES